MITMGLFDIFRKKKTDNQEEEGNQQASRVSSESLSDQTSDQLLEEQHDVQSELDKSEAPVVKSPETETETETETQTETIASAAPTVNVLSQVLQRYSQPRAKPTLAEEIAEEEQQAAFKLDTTPPPDLDTELSFPAIKGLMIDTLRQYGGLLARGLIEKIDKCENTSELKRCHMAWLTLLQETRLPAKQLHSLVKHLQKFYHLHETETHQ